MASGQRVSKSYSYFLTGEAIVPLQPGEVTHYTKQYHYDQSGRLLVELINETRYGDTDVSKSLKYLYDESGIIGVQYTSGANTNTYYYLRNLLGDVIGIYNTSGTKVVGYTYDAWGNCTIDSLTTNYDLAHDNPIRYRGYYYDEDTGLYYLNARYYNPEWRRFISPDDTAYIDAETPNGLNLYCYCGNDPVMYKQTPISSNYTITTTAISIGCSNNVAGSSGPVASGINWRQALSYIRGMFSTYTDYSRKIVSVDLDFIWFGYEQGKVYSKIAGNDSAPIALFTKVAEEPWKFWDYKIGIKHNIGNFSYSYGQGIGEADISFALGNSSTDITLGIFRMGIGFSNTIDDTTYYNQVYFRPVAILISLVIAKWAIPFLLTSMEQSRIPQGAY